MQSSVDLNFRSKEKLTSKKLTAPKLKGSGNVDTFFLIRIESGHGGGLFAYFAAVAKVLHIQYSPGTKWADGTDEETARIGDRFRIARAVRHNRLALGADRGGHRRTHSLCLRDIKVCRKRKSTGRNALIFNIINIFVERNCGMIPIPRTSAFPLACGFHTLLCWNKERIYSRRQVWDCHVILINILIAMSYIRRPIFPEEASAIYNLRLTSVRI